MHAEARRWVAAHAPSCVSPVLEVGSRDINGGVRDLFPADGFVGIDLQPGPGVDKVADVVDLDGRQDFATVVCCEVLEHAPDPAGVLDAIFRLLTIGGTLILTAAGPTRTPHSRFDGGEVRDGEHYANVSRAELEDWLSGFNSVVIDEHGDDIRAVAVK